MAVIKLKYFNARGRMEAIRWVLEYAGVSYEDIRFEREQWPEQKASKWMRCWLSDKLFYSNNKSDVQIKLYSYDLQ